MGISSWQFVQLQNTENIYLRVLINHKLAFHSFSSVAVQLTVKFMESSVLSYVIDTESTSTHQYLAISILIPLLSRSRIASCRWVRKAEGHVQSFNNLPLPTERVIYIPVYSLSQTLWAYTYRLVSKLLWFSKDCGQLFRSSKLSDAGHCPPSW